ncbi:MAG TPA: DUF2723 domain-containing protein [Vicinamibacterales bacterium]|nr:DUF2723 domain-containing protein [Vicinamibacterales bacterium]
MTRRLLASVAVALVAFVLYHATLLPGFDFGDTGSFQTIVGSSEITPRDAYPLYFAIGGAFVHVTGLDHAFALNLLSAIEGAAASGLLVLLASELSGSLLAGIASALLFATSYTFWSQATIAEVYALHAIFVTLTTWLLLRWAQQPTLRRLTMFFAVYALAFGNHLSTVLLLPGFTVFLLMAAPCGWRSMFAPRIVAVALVCAAAGAMQYAWNLSALWAMPHPPSGIADALRTFWFDVTKSDWRETMVLNVPSSMLRDHVAMYWFDVTQQFGPIVPVLSAIGLIRLFVTDAKRGVLFTLLFAVNFLFAFNYNVGDTHVFYLPSHLMLALLVAPAVVAQALRPAAGSPNGLRYPVSVIVGYVASALVIGYAGVRAYHDFPAMDRSHDTRPTQALDRLTNGVDDQRAILLTDLNWQVANGLSYYAKEMRPEVVHARMPDVLLYAPTLIADNAAIHRDVVVTDRARQELDAAYGPLIGARIAPNTQLTRLPMEIAELPRGTRYVLCVLRPSRDLPLDADELAGAYRLLTGTASSVPDGDYVAIAGTTGRPPDLVAASGRPFDRDVKVDGVHVEIRMEAWLASDTIRRMGFGHVIANRQHTLIVERGISFVAFDDAGTAIRTAYRANIFAPLPRYVCYR